MSSKIDIRNLYHPIQPTVKQSATAVTYTEYLPAQQLLPYIYCYWQLKTTASLSDLFSYRVVADGCIDIFFDLNKPQESFVMGFCKKYTEFPLEPAFNYFGIRFLPTMFPLLFKINAVDISNKAEELQSIVPQIAAFIQQTFTEAQNPATISQKLDTYFIKHLAKTDVSLDRRLHRAIELILQHDGVLQIEDLANNISQRQLRRLFEFYIGDTAKTFAKVVKFQNILRAKPSLQSLKANKLFYSGYYDQAHFIKDFKTFYGVTPGKAFGN